MIFNFCFLFVVYLNCIKINYIQCSQDSDGKSFITSFANYKVANPDDWKIELHLIPAGKDAISVTVTYYRLNDNSKQQFNIDALPYRNSIVSLRYRDVVFDQLTFNPIINQIPDTRIKVSSQNNFKVIARIYNTKTGHGDAYLIQDSNFFKPKYSIKLPKANPGAAQIIQIFSKSNTNVTVTIMSDKGHVQNLDLYINSKEGNKQNTLVFPPSLIDSSIFVDAGKEPIYVIAAVSCVDLLATGDNFNSNLNSQCDYTAFIPLGIDTISCRDYLKPPFDLRMTSSKFTKAIYVTPPIVDCQNYFQEFYFDDDYRINGTSVDFKTEQSSKIELDVTRVQEIGLMSRYGLSPWIRLGGIRSDQNLNQLTTAFMHPIIETSQFFNESISFVAFSSLNILEIVGNNILDPSSFTLNNKQIDPKSIEIQNNQIFQKQFTTYRITLPSAAFYNFNSNGNYAAYIYGNNKDHLMGSFGYLCGMNYSKLTLTDPIGPSPITTTTKGASKKTILTLLLVLFYFLLRII